MKTYTRKFGICLVFLLFSISIQAEPRFFAPENEKELRQRMQEIKKEYTPYLQSLPKKLSIRQQTNLNGNWIFRFEVMDAPEDSTLPETPAWYTPISQSSDWEETTVPRWQYRRGKEGSILGGKDQFGWAGRRETSNIVWYKREFKAKKPTGENRVWLCFDSVDWEAEVYLNGQHLGNHRVYYEPFRFDITDKVQKTNTLAVRIIDGHVYGEPHAFWTPLPDARAEEQIYYRDKKKSLKGVLPIGYHDGSGFGILGDVYLEETAPVMVSAIFARNNLSGDSATINIELGSPTAQAVSLNIQLLPENFKGDSYEKTVEFKMKEGVNKHSLTIPMPGAAVWSPQTPNLYRCRVKVVSDEKVIDFKDVLFGCRSFTIVSKQNPQQNLPEGTLLLNGDPCYLRGTNMHALNGYWFWGEDDKLINAILMLKAANFNAIRVCQHINFPEVRELMDRMGILSEQDQGEGYPDLNAVLTPQIRQQLIHTGTVLARETYNNPGVILLTFVNECHFDTTDVVKAVLAVDPERIVKPISGRLNNGGQGKELLTDQSLWANCIDDTHRYEGWYGAKSPQTWYLNYIHNYGKRLITIGEYGAEAMDSYETMKEYPKHLRPPSAQTDTLWASSQIIKTDARQIQGFGRKPKNLAEYIEASQNWQEQSVADQTIGFRLSKNSISGYFHFYFLDLTPAFWPKSIVSFDHRPKKAFYQMAQINQPVVALPKFIGEKPDAMILWVVNDLNENFKNCMVEYLISKDGQTFIHGTDTLSVPAVDAVSGKKIDISTVTSTLPDFELSMILRDNKGRIISTYNRQIRCLVKKEKENL